MKKIVGFTLGFPRTIILFFLCLTFCSLIVSLNYLKIDTSTDGLINKDLKFKIDQANLKKEFKILDNNVLIRISGKNKEEVNKVSNEILIDLTDKKELNFFYSPQTDPVFRKNFFTFLNSEQKNELISKLYQFQPFISELNSNTKFTGLNNLLELILKSENKNNEDFEGFQRIFKSFILSLNNKKYVDWTELLNTDLNNYIILGFEEEGLKNNGFVDFYNYLTSISSKYKTVEVRYTGGIVIDYEEISSVADGASNAGIISIILVAVILLFAFRNFKNIFFIILTILSGLTITMALTTIFIGHLNLISVAFAVLFIGLSVDFGIQIYSRFLENSSKKIDLKKKLDNDTSGISSTLLMASVPSMVGFISFIPTNYIGLSELGIISFFGLIVGLLTNIFLFTSLQKQFGCFDKQYESKNTNKYEEIFKYFEKKKKIIFLILLIILGYNVLYYKSLNFDSDPLNLKDNSLGSVKLAKELIEQNPTSDYVISVLLDEQQLKNKSLFENLNSKKSIKSTFSYSELIEDYKNEELDYFKFLISSQNSNNFYSNIEDFEKFKSLLKSIISLDELSISFEAKILLDKLEKQIHSQEDFRDIEERYFRKFDDLVGVLNRLGNKDDLLLKNLPFFYKDRYLSVAKKYRVEIFPSKDVSKKENLKEFVIDVLDVFPNATGMPIVQYFAGEVVIDSFIFAIFVSISFLLFFLSLIFKNFKFVLITFSCLLLGVTFTVFFMILFNLNFNFANMISLPLLFSLGVSYPVYFLRRYRELGNLNKVIRSKTPPAILLSASTTICSFSTLAISGHQGTSSMGILLFISLTMTLISSLIFLPLMIKMFKISSR